MPVIRHFWMCAALMLALAAAGRAQAPGSPKAVPVPADTPVTKKHNPRLATLRSAILPGWGQAYNRKYWKIPLVYAAIGIPAYTFFYNRQWYTRTSEAATMLSSTPPDTADYRKRVNELLWVFFNNPNSVPSLLNYRNQYRRDMDYSILITLLMWGLNVVDATVDGHLRDFDISDNLSLRIKPTLMPGTSAAGISLVFTLGRHGPSPGAR